MDTGSSQSPPFSTSLHSLPRHTIVSLVSLALALLFWLSTPSAPACLPPASLHTGPGGEAALTTFITASPATAVAAARAAPTPAAAAAAAAAAAPPSLAAAPPPSAAASAAPPAAPAAAASPAAGYAQPPSKKRVWFDGSHARDFKPVPLLAGALSPSAPLHPHWIVVTSINPPTPTIHKLAALPGWRVVVIGDTKTPKDWAWPNVTYLDIAAQRALGFSTEQLTKTRAYTRKNLGYLYAVLHGARVIYETDDDNALQEADVVLARRALREGAPLPSLRRWLADAAAAGGGGGAAAGEGAKPLLEYVSPALTINHHAHFGQPSTWPRGYPLEAIGEPHAGGVRERPLRALVQQGLANGDPDMDAVFRLTRKPAATRIDFSFTPAPPIALPMGAFGPYNAQNTVFLHDALWATPLPQTVEFRVCDIWRAYYTQRLLWGVGGQLAFVAPYVYQLRNSHSYLDDYVSEAQIFDQVAQFLEFLKAWRCGPEARKGGLPGCAHALAVDAAVGGFWGAADAELMRHFFHDLGRAGYQFPPWTEALEGAAPWAPAACEGAACKAPAPVKMDAIETRPSITLHGTCEEELPEEAVVKP
jgi:hypothetical protein